LELIKIDRLRPAPYNPREAVPAREQALMESLRAFGFVIPLYVLRDGTILSGHQRLRAAKRLGYEQVPIETLNLNEKASRAVNLMFNISTNDLNKGQLTEALFTQAVDVADRLKAMPDAADPFPCMHARPMSPRMIDLCGADKRPNAESSSRVAAQLMKMGVRVPAVIDKATRRIINGRWRVLAAIRNGAHAWPVVEICDEHDLLGRCLNGITMRFELRTYYGDLLRHNSFRRSRNTRHEIQPAFVYWVMGRFDHGIMDLSQPGHLQKFISTYGRHILDWGGGHGTDVELIRDAGIDAVLFEPFKIRPGTNVIDPNASRQLARDLFKRVSQGPEFNSVFLNHVLNSVPFTEDRDAILTILGELCSTGAAAYISTKTVTNGSFQYQEISTNGGSLRLDGALEPGTTLGDLTTGQPKVQKYFTVIEFRRLMSKFFRSVEAGEPKGSSCKGMLVSRNRKSILKPWHQVKAALAFEFDLPYPDGSRMGLAEQAIEAFAARRRRLGLPLE
jgi:hypothetical protein